MRGIRQITGTGIMEGNCIEKRTSSKNSRVGSIVLPCFSLCHQGYTEYERSLKKPICFVSSGGSCRLMLLVAIVAVHRPGAIGLEGNLTCISSLCAGSIMHLSWAPVAATVSASVSLHLDSLTLGIDSMNRSTAKTTQQTRFEATLMQLFGGGRLI
jgi:hypothetical protein